MLAIITGAAPPTSPVLPRLLTVRSSGTGTILFEQDHLYAATVRGKNDVLESYVLPGAGGAAHGQWSVPLDMDPGALTIQSHHGVLLVQQFDGAVDGPQLTTFDQYTGRALWQSDGSPFGYLANPDTVLLYGPTPREIQSVHLATGKRQWDLDIPTDCAFAFSPTDESEPDIVQPPGRGVHEQFPVAHHRSGLRS